MKVSNDDFRQFEVEKLIEDEKVNLILELFLPGFLGGDFVFGLLGHKQ
ncbi:MAG: hypothetical protein IPN18_08465 [Ignavibacteriales bacterium]|nr:hypothetical protein [Ignavibacteriales bacterium]